MIYGVSVVRNEADIIAICLRHHFINEGFDRILIADNGSTDDTVDVIQSMKHPKISLSHAPGQYRQSEIVTALAREAHAAGATWIVPFDADEFWHTPGGLAVSLGDTHDADCLKVDVVNYVQSHSVITAKPHSILDVCYKSRKPFGLYEDAEANVTEDRCSFTEMPYPEKYISRAGADMVIAPGNHDPQPNARLASPARIRCLHVPLRAKSILDNKPTQSKRLDEAGFPSGHGWHIRRFATIFEREGFDIEWHANSQQNGFFARDVV